MGERRIVRTGKRCNTATECRENDNMQKGQEKNQEMTESQASKGSKIKQNKENNKRKKT